MPQRPRTALQSHSGLLMLILLSLLAISLQLGGRTRALPPERVTPQLRILEWRLVWAEGRPTALAAAVATLQQEPLAPWDALALGAWLQARGQDRAAEALFARIPAHSSAAGQVPWARQPREAASPESIQRLGASLAGGLARGRTPEDLLREAQHTMKWASLLAAAALTLGLAFLIWLLAFDRSPGPATPSLPLSGPALLQVLLVWFLALQASGPLVGALLSPLPLLRPLAMPLAYGLHAGVALLGLRVALAGNPLRKMAGQWRTDPQFPIWVLGFGGLAVLALLATGWGIGPWWPFRESPQRELGEHLARVSGLELGAFFMTAAVLAPIFEEFLFRGVLQPWLLAHLPPGAGRSRTALALLAGGLVFGAFHLEPAAFPTLGALGVCLGWAAWRSGSLWVPILLHALWNGGLVLLNRAFLVP